MSDRVVMREMSKIEFKKYRDMVIGEYTEDIIDAYRISLKEISEEEAYKQAVSQFEALTPKGGKNTENNCLYMVLEDNIRLGVFWYYFTTIMDEDIAFIADIRVDVTKRNQGYARAILHNFEAEVMEKGYHRFGVYVQNNNLPAIHLFESEGYNNMYQDGHILYMKKEI